MIFNNCDWMIRHRTFTGTFWVNKFFYFFSYRFDVRTFLQGAAVRFPAWEENGRPPGHAKPTFITAEYKYFYPQNIFIYISWYHIDFANYPISEFKLSIIELYFLSIQYWFTKFHLKNVSILYSLLKTVDLSDLIIAICYCSSDSNLVYILWFLFMIYPLFPSSIVFCLEGKSVNLSNRAISNVQSAKSTFVYVFE